MQIESYLQVMPVHGTGIHKAALFSRILLLLRDSRIGHYAVGFPDLLAPSSVPEQPSLGEKLQIFGPAMVIQAAENVLRTRLDGYISLSAAAPVGPVSQYMCCRRIRNHSQTRATTERQLRRDRKRAEQGKRPPVTEAEAQDRLSHLSPSSLPYLIMRSHTTSQTFSLFFHTTPAETEIPGEFDQFGFARTNATIPHLP